MGVKLKDDLIETYVDKMFQKCVGICQGGMLVFGNLTLNLRAMSKCADFAE